MNLGWTLPKRHDFLLKKLEEQPRPNRNQTITFQNRLTSFDVHSIPIDLPKYRLENGRTLAAQEEYLSKHPELGDDYFEKSNAEDYEVQLTQHNILKKMLKSSAGDLKTIFKKNIQKEPLILTREGFVVNGNRRLCAMREILQEDRDNNYGHFKNIDVIILPHCSEEDIDRLEAHLQILKDIKADYTWVAEAKMLKKRHEEIGYRLEDLASLYDLKLPEVKRKISILEYVDQYLESIGAKHEYFRVEKDEYAFKQIKKYREKLKDEDKREIFQTLSFNVLASSKEDGKGRLYEYIPKIYDHFDSLIMKVQEEFDIESSESNELDDLFGGEESNDFDDLAISLEKIATEQKSTLTSVVQEVVDTKEELKGEKEAKEFTLEKVKKSNNWLKEAYLSYSEDSISEGIEEQLQAIEESVQNIRKVINSNDLN